MKRSIASFAAIAAAAFLAACGPVQSDPKQTSTSPTPAAVQAAPLPSSALPEFTQADAEHYLRLQKEHPKYFTNCSNQDVKSWWGNVAPNLQVVGVVRFNEGGYPDGFKTEELGTKFTVTDGTTNVTVTWTQPSGIKLDSVIVYRSHLSGTDKWLRWTQSERGGINETNFNKKADEWHLRVDDAWYIMGYNSDVPCAGRNFDLHHPYHEIDWRALFRNGQLDKR